MYKSLGGVRRGLGENVGRSPEKTRQELRKGKVQELQKGKVTGRSSEG